MTSAHEPDMQPGVTGAAEPAAALVVAGPGRFALASEPIDGTVSAVRGVSETVVASILAVAAALVVGNPVPFGTMAIIAPLSLLRTEESVNLGLKWFLTFDAWVRRRILSRSWGWLVFAPLMCASMLVIRVTATLVCLRLNAILEAVLTNFRRIAVRGSVFDPLEVVPGVRRVRAHQDCPDSTLTEIAAAKYTMDRARVLLRSREEAEALPGGRKGLVLSAVVALPAAIFPALIYRAALKAAASVFLPLFLVAQDYRAFSLSRGESWRYIRDSASERWRVGGAVLIGVLIFLPLVLAVSRFDNSGSAGPWRWASMVARAAYLPGGLLGIWIATAIAAAGATLLLAFVAWCLDDREPYILPSNAAQPPGPDSKALRKLGLLRFLLVFRGSATAVSTFYAMLLYAQIAWSAIAAFESFEVPGLRWSR